MSKEKWPGTPIPPEQPVKANPAKIGLYRFWLSVIALCASEKHGSYPIP